MADIYRLRVILDNEHNVFRDIEIEKTASLELFHDTIVNAFGLDGIQMASFYQSNDDWEQGQEYSLFDMFDEQNPDTAIMSAFTLEEVIDDIGDKLLYIYDFFNMWTFYVELMRIEEREDGETYPRLVLELGSMPTEKEDTQFTSEEMPEGEGDFKSFDDLDDIGFDEDEWN